MDVSTEEQLELQERAAASFTPSSGGRGDSDPPGRGRLMVAYPITLAHPAPAGGATAEELIPATLVAVLAIAAVAAFGVAHRSGRTQLLTRAGAVAERWLGMPAWAALPSVVAGVSLVVAAFGFYADVASHIDNGRDPGPFANPFHYFIIIGLAGIALAGIVALLLGSKETPSSLRIREGWHAPVGGILLLVCGGIAVAGFPLDDVWHRLFGQDVTLWSPTHMQMVGGAVFSTLALWILLVEGRHAQRNTTAGTSSSLAEWIAAAALLVGLSAFQAEFDYSVPQFRLLYHPVLLMLSAGPALVLARIRLGRGGALKAVGLFLVLRGILTIIVGQVLDHTTLHFPLYLAEAVAVELVALHFSTSRQVTFGVVAGVAIGTFGLAAEWAWSHVWMTMEWPSALLPEAVVLGLIAAVSGGALGGLVARAFVPPECERETVPRVAGIATGIAILFVLAYPFPTTSIDDASATVALDATDHEPRSVHATITLHPADLAEGANWFNVTAWQGGGSVVDELKEIEPGTYRTTTAIPVHDGWKALIRLQRGDSTMAVPIYLPEDAAIPAREVPAEGSFTRPFVVDKTILLREAKDVSEPLVYGASTVMLLIASLWALTLGWGLYRLQSSQVSGDIMFGERTTSFFDAPRLGSRGDGGRARVLQGGLVPGEGGEGDPARSLMAPASAQPQSATRCCNDSGVAFNLGHVGERYENDTTGHIACARDPDVCRDIGIGNTGFEPHPEQ